MYISSTVDRRGHTLRIAKNKMPEWTGVFFSVRKNVTINALSGDQDLAAIVTQEDITWKELKKRVRNILRPYKPWWKRIHVETIEIPDEVDHKFDARIAYAWIK